MRLISPLVAVLVLAALAGGPARAGDAAPASAQKWMPWIELGGFYGTDNTSFGEAIVFAPLLQGSRDLLFFEGRGKLFEEEAREGNFALGYRQMTTSGFNLGIWLGGDVRTSELGNTFDQLSGGLEALSADFDVRVNVYGPITGPQAGAPGFTDVVLQGNNIFMVGGQEVGLHGVDGEAGVRLPVEMLRIDPFRVELRLYGGAFYFDNSDALNDVAGGKARAELHINDVIAAIPGSRLTAEYQVSHDDVRETRQVIGARLRLPLDPPDTPKLASLTAQERRMIDPIERDIDVVTTQSKAEPVEDALTKVNFDKVAYVGDGGDLTATSNAAGANTLIIATGGTVTGPQTLQGQQTLQGGGSTISVQGQRSGTVAPFTAPGSRPTFFNDDPTFGGSSTISVLGSSVHIAGIDLVGADPFIWSSVPLNAGITDDCGCTPVLNTFIENVNINQFAGVGIAFFSNSEITITNTTITNIGNVGIAFGYDNHVTLSGITVSDVLDGNGIQFFDGNSVTITNTVVNWVNSISSPFGGIGIAFGYDNRGVTLSGVTVSNTYNDGIQFYDGNVASISDTVVNDSGAVGIRFGDGNDFSISRTTITRVCCAGIEFGYGNTAVIADTMIDDAHSFGVMFIADNNVTMTNVAISNTGLEGVRFYDDNTVAITRSRITDVGTVGTNGVSFGDGNTVTIADTAITRAYESGITFGDDNLVTIARTTIRDVGYDGIYFYNANMVSITDSTISNAGAEGLAIFGRSNAVELAGTTFSGSFGNVIRLFDAPNVLSGTGNVLDVPLGTSFCVDIGGQTGTFTFVSPPGTCP